MKHNTHQQDRRSALSDFLLRNREHIIQEWARRLHSEVGEQYYRRPPAELTGTVSEAYEDNFHVLIHNDFKPIDRFIETITRIRLETGFSLSDVQKAFELFRIIVIPLLAEETAIEEFHEHITDINRCLAYTIHRFSDYFQGMHEKTIREHNLRLEEEVRIRTAELRESELKYKTLVEEISDGYFVVRDEIIIFANRAFCKMHGAESEQIVGEKFYTFIAPENRKEIIEIYNKSLEKISRPRAFEYTRLTKEGKRFPTEIMARITHYENRLSTIGICRDITERVKMEQRVREAERMAYIGQITTSLSHEIRNPLSAVKMNLQILKKNQQIQGNDQRRIDIAVREVIRLEGILKELLDFAKPLQLKISDFNINSILSAAVELLEIKFDQKQVAVFQSFDSEIPAMQADGEKLGQAFINLLLNAFDASESKSTIWIYTHYHPNDSPRSRIEVVIEDEGQGFSEKHLSEIFEPFFTTKTKGTGLGLTNVKRIAEAHGGRISVSKREPRGACFRLYLPVRQI